MKEVTLTALEPEDLEVLYTIENDQQQWLVSNTNVPFSVTDKRVVIVDDGCHTVDMHFVTTYPRSSMIFTLTTRCAS